MKPLVALALLAASTAPAIAHPGSHGEVTSAETALAHVLGSPFHILMILAAVAGAIGLLKVLRKRRQASSA